MSVPNSPEDQQPESSPQIQQDTEGNQNQIIGSAIGSTIVNSGGGEVTIYLSQKELQPTKPQSQPSKLKPNPYKGLLAFQETDSDRFFGRTQQIGKLWQKFSNLYTGKSTTRVLCIYGPSGSGKSSLARAGLIPELARHPLQGQKKLRVVVLVPGTNPIESLAEASVRMTTQDILPVAKIRELKDELTRINAKGDHDGLRRIAGALPEIDSSPLIVLVDQFEEIYTLCEDKAERDAFVGNLLHAAEDQTRRVSVILTLRSDFLGETQEHPSLNGLFSKQGFLVPAMMQDELRQAIAEPAKQAGDEFDQATIDLLINQTEGREGALPLLQFALTRIWEGLTEGKKPAAILNEIGGVGGALAGKAQHIFERLSCPTEQEIARRVFLGLVQLGEGTKDTRRRVEVQQLVSHRDNPEQVKQVIAQFAGIEERLITLAASVDRTSETAEITHEALFDHWQQFQKWLDSSRSDLRFQRRLDEAAKYWDENDRPEGSLWRSPDLDLLRQHKERYDGEMTQLQMDFFRASIRERKRGRQIILMLCIVGAITAIITSYLYQDAKQKEQNILQKEQNISYLNKEKDRLYNQFAYCPTQKGQPGEKVGEKCFRRLKTSGEVSVFLSNTNFKLSQGIEAFKRGEYKKSIRLFENAIDGDRNDPVPQIFLNNALARQHNESFNPKLKPPKLAAVVSIDYYEAAATEVLRGIADAQKEFNDKRESSAYPFMEIVIVNDQNEPKAGETIAQELVKDRSILGVIGHHASESTSAAQNKYKLENMPVISPTSSSSKIQGDQFFRTVGSTEKAAIEYTSYIRNQLKLDKVAVFYNQGSEYSKALKGDFEKRFYGQGGKAIKEIDISPDAFNIKTEIQAIVDYKLKAALIISNVQTNSVSISINRRNTHPPLNQRLQLLGTMSLSEHETLGKGGKSVEGMILVRPCLASQSESEYVSTATKRWEQQEINWRTATSYDATQAFIKAIEALNLSKDITRKEILRRLQSPSFSLKKEDTSGFGLKWERLPNGSLSLDRSNVNRKYCVVQIKDGKFKELPSN